MLDSAPLPIWLRNKDGKLSWVNQAYVKAVEMPDSDAVLKSSIEIASPRPHRHDKGRSQDRPAGPDPCGVCGCHAGPQHLRGRYLPRARPDLPSMCRPWRKPKRNSTAISRPMPRRSTSSIRQLPSSGPTSACGFTTWPLRSSGRSIAKWLDLHPTDGEILDRLRAQRCIPEQANYREWRAKQLSSYTTLEMRESWWYLPDGRSLHVVCEQHPFRRRHLSL